MSYVTDSFDERIVKILQKGGVGLLPTDTIYGLSSRALDQKAVGRIHRLKARSSNKPFIVLISDIKMLDLLSISYNQTKVIEKYWPGPLSVIFDTPAAPAWLTLGTGSLAVRFPEHPQLVELINNTGPLVSTSANTSGSYPSKTVKEVQEVFGDGLDFYVNAGELDNHPSTLALIEAGQLKIIRQGAVKIS